MVVISRYGRAGRIDEIVASEDRRVICGDGVAVAMNGEVGTLNGSIVSVNSGVGRKAMCR
jgi:hypothetical protein